MEHAQIAAMPTSTSAGWWLWTTWIAQLIVAAVLAQTLYFKFTYAPETEYIFADRGGRPAATIVGIFELVCVVLLFTPRLASLGAGLSLLVIGGAIFTHLTSLGIQVKNPTTGESDGGLLFGLAMTVAVGSMLVLALRWSELVDWLEYVRAKVLTSQVPVPTEPKA